MCVCRPRAHSCPGSTAVGIALLCARSASSFLHGDVTTFGFFSLRTRRSPRSSCVGRPALVADLNNPSVGVDASPGGVVVSGRLTRRATASQRRCWAPSALTDDGPIGQAAAGDRGPPKEPWGDHGHAFGRAAAAATAAAAAHRPGGIQTSLPITTQSGGCRCSAERRDPGGDGGATGFARLWRPAALHVQRVQSGR